MSPLQQNLEGETRPQTARLLIAEGLVEALSTREGRPIQGAWSILAALGHLHGNGHYLWAPPENPEDDTDQDAANRLRLVAELGPAMAHWGPSDCRAAVNAAGFILFGDSNE